MPRYIVDVSSVAEAQIDALDGSVRVRVIKKIQALKEDPRPAGCKKLMNSEHWRIRVGDHRVVYDIEDAKLVVLVVGVGHRREIYR